MERKKIGRRDGIRPEPDRRWAGTNMDGYQISQSVSLTRVERFSTIADAKNATESQWGGDKLFEGADIVELVGRSCWVDGL